MLQNAFSVVIRNASLQEYRQGNRGEGRLCGLLLIFLNGGAEEASLSYFGR